MYAPSGLLESIIAIEMALVALIILVTFVAKYFFYLSAKNNKRKSENINEYITTSLENNLAFDSKYYLSSWRKLNLVIPVITNINSVIKNVRWVDFRRDMTKSVLLPIARKKAGSRLWLQRFLATQCFAILIEEQDIKTIETLIYDKIPIVSIHAMFAAINSCNEILINHVISCMAIKRRIGQTVFLKMFENAKPPIDNYILNRLEFENDPYVRATCYKLLIKFPLTTRSSTLNLAQDLTSENIELKLSALRFYATTRKNASIPTLLELLKSNNWEVKVTCIHLLGGLNAEIAIPELEGCLKDHTWWVRVAAATTLKKMGEKGIAILKKQSPDNDLYAYETAMHVLEVPYE